MRQGERVEALERRVGELEERLRGGLESVGAAVMALGEEQAGAVRVVERRVAALEAWRSTAAEAPAGETGPERRERPRSVPRRLHPELVTMEAEEGEEQVYGEATAVIVEWRGAHAGLMRLLKSGPALRRNAVNQRMLELEVALIEEHGLTLPPAMYPWDWAERRDEAWRRRGAAGAGAC